MDSYAHLLSRAPMSQSAKIPSSSLTVLVPAVVLKVVEMVVVPFVTTKFVINCVNVFT